MSDDRIRRLFDPYYEDMTSSEYTEGPVTGKCRNCDGIWVISYDGDDTWDDECPYCDTAGDYIMDPPEGRHYG